MKKTLSILLLCGYLLMPRSSNAMTIDYIQWALDAVIAVAAGYYNSLLESITDKEAENEENLAAAKTDTASTIQTMALAEAGVYNSTFKQHVLTLQAIDNAREFSPMAQSSYACCEEEVATTLVQGISKRKEYQKSLYDGVVTYNTKFGSKAQLYDQVIKIGEKEDIDLGWSVFPLYQTIDSPKNAASNIILNTNPTPSVELAPDVAHTTMGQNYELLRKIQLSKLAVPQQVTTEIVSYHMPTHPSEDWNNQMLEAKGLSSWSKPEVVNSEMSADAVLSRQIDSRYGNPNWGIDLHRKLPDGLLRELIQMEAIDMKLQQRLLRLEKQRLALYAQDSANIISAKYDKQLSKLRKQAIILQRED